MAKVDISGIDKAELLAALYNGSQPMGMGVLRAKLEDMKPEEARGYLERPETVRDYVLPNPAGYFDYLHGRPLKIDISGDSLDTWGYNRDNGPDAAEKIIESLR